MTPRAFAWDWCSWIAQDAKHCVSHAAVWYDGYWYCERHQPTLPVRRRSRAENARAILHGVDRPPWYGKTRFQLLDWD